jgi:hypothetical protein
MRSEGIQGQGHGEHGYPTGVRLSNDNDFVLVSELFRNNRISTCDQSFIKKIGSWLRRR